MLVSTDLAGLTTPAAHMETTPLLLDHDPFLQVGKKANLVREREKGRMDENILLKYIVRKHYSDIHKSRLWKRIVISI